MKISITSTVALAIAIATISSTPSVASAADITVVGADAGDTNMKNMNMKNMNMKTMDKNMDKRMRMRGSTSDRTAAAGANVKIAAMDVLNKPTALINKNTLAMDNNVFVSRSNIVFSQSDRLALAKKVEDVLSSDPSTATATTSASTEATETDVDTKGAEASKDVATAVLTKNVLRAVSGKDTDTDAALMSKASAVVAVKGDAVLRGQRIADLVDAVFDRKTTTKSKSMDTGMNMDMSPMTDATRKGASDVSDATSSLSIEQTVQTDAPRGVIVLVGTKDILRQPTAAVNKNFVMSDNQVAISRSRVSPTQNDKVVLSGGAKVADAVVPGGSVRVAVAGKTMDDTKEGAVGDNYRVGFLYRKESKKEDATTAETKTEAEHETEREHERFGLWGVGGCGFGWRYPIGYWNMYGAGLYGGGCGLGLAYGPYFYC